MRAAIDALFDYGRPLPRPARGRGRPRAPRAPAPAGLRRQEPADRARRAGHRPRRGARRGRRGRHRRAGGGGMKRHLLSIDDLSREDIDRILERAASFAEVSGREIKKVPTLRGRTVINLFYEASTRTSSSFELAAKRLSADLVNIKSAGSAVDKGESLKDTVQTLVRLRPRRDRDPLSARGRGRAGGPLDRSVGDQRGRRQARAPDPGPARPLHAAEPRGVARGPQGLDRRRRAAQSRRALVRPGVRSGRRRGHGVRPADADPARRRDARLPGAPHARRGWRCRRRVRAADAARAHAGQLRAVTARVRGELPDRRQAAAARPAPDASRARSTAASSWRRR